MNFTKRIAKLERRILPNQQWKTVLRYQGPGSEKYPQPTQQELDEASSVITVTFVAARAADSPNPGPLDSSVARSAT